MSQYLNNAQGPLLTLPTSGLLVKTSALTSGTSFITGPTTNSIRIRMWGSGGDGGATVNAGSFNSGGGAGGYCEAVIAVTPSTAYTYAVGVTLASNFTVAGVTYAAARGSTPGSKTNNGLAGVVQGGAGGNATNGQINATGQSGDPAMAVDATPHWLVCGAGGSCLVGGGGTGVVALSSTSIVGNSGTGHGSGGGGSMGGSAAGTGTGGMIIVEEYQ